MKKEKGFTLIELLAVIIILIIIAIITIPTTLNVINKAKEKAFQNTVYGVIDEIRLLALQQIFSENDTEIIVHFQNQIPDNSNFKVSGATPDSGSIRLTKEGKIELKLWNKELKKCIKKEQDKENVSFTNIKEEECKIEIINPPTSIAKTFAEIMQSSDEVMSNDPDNNLRYVGPNPNNYIIFNNELWRIIGIFNEQAKIMRNEPYSTSIKWNSENKNDWSTATLQNDFNTTYLNNINNTSQLFIDQSHIWNLGGMPYGDTNKYTRINMYQAERSTTVYKGNATTWTGSIGLIYPSDYGYATNSTDTVCNNSMYNWDNESEMIECRDKNWIYKNIAGMQWTLTLDSSRSNAIFSITTRGQIFGNYGVTSNFKATPVLYLKPDVKIMNGQGTIENPYQLSI